MSYEVILDWNKYIEAARTASAEGCVLLENKGNVLPLKKGEKVSVFGRIQNHYYKSGTGSGGMVNVSKVIGVVDGLRESGCVEINEKLYEIYQAWEEEYPYNEGEGWGNEPWSQAEMELSDEIAEEAGRTSDVAIVIIGRTAGEDRDSGNNKGSFMLTDIEESMLSKVRKNFDKMIVLLNVGGLIDMGFMDKYNPEAVMYIWQGGMVGGLGLADVLTGKVSPSGHLTDTIAYNISDYPSNPYFGKDEKNYYGEDIYVGYRFFETFAKEKVRYPFGYGLSYTKFDIAVTDFENDFENKEIRISVNVKNTGDTSGKEVVQVYMGAPCAKLGKAEKVLVDFAKTKVLSEKVDSEESLDFNIPYEAFASYDDTGVTGAKFANVIEAGTYTVYVGENVRDAVAVGSFEIEELLVLEQLETAMAPVEEFERMKAYRVEESVTENLYKPVLEKIEPSKCLMEERRQEKLPSEIEQKISNIDRPNSDDKNSCEESYKLADVLSEKVTMDEFISQMTDDDLSCIIRGEGMGSSRVTPGTAAAFGGVSESLIKRLGIPSVCCSDGPSGMRLDCGVKAFSLPNGTMLGCTFNTGLVEELYSYMGLEMIANKVDCLLGPGMNIHRHPLNGRNFEYFSEDPYLTGKMGIAVIRGLKKSGVSGTAKHFCANNQEYKRRASDSVVSERALREIYLKGFEMLVKDGYVDSIMTSYGSVNGLWTAGNYDLNTTILRNQWGYKGVVMTDWWADINERGKKPDKKNFAAMARSQNDMYMVCPDGSSNATGDNTLDSLYSGSLSRGELQRNAANICSMVMNTQAMKRLIGTDTKVTIINRPEEEMDVDLENVEFMVLDEEISIPVDKPSKAGTNYVLPFEVKKTGVYEVLLTGSSNPKIGELAQLPCTLFFTSYPIATFTFHGTKGEDMTVKRTLELRDRFCVMRLFVARNGLDLKEIKFKLIESKESWH